MKDGICVRACQSGVQFQIWPFLGSLFSLFALIIVIICMCTLGWAVADRADFAVKVGLLRKCVRPNLATADDHCSALDTDDERFHSAGVTAFVLLVLSCVAAVPAIGLGWAVSWEWCGRQRWRWRALFMASWMQTLLCCAAFTAYAAILYAHSSYKDLPSRATPFSWVYCVIAAMLSLFSSLVATTWLFCWSDKSADARRGLCATLCCACHRGDSVDDVDANPSGDAESACEADDEDCATGDEDGDEDASAEDASAASDADEDAEENDEDEDEDE